MSTKFAHVIRQAKLTFDRKNASTFKTNFRLLKHLVDQLSILDLDIDQELYSKRYFSRPNKAPCTYLNIYEDDIVAMSVFILADSYQMPLHDHPMMFGILRSMTGKLHVQSYTALTTTTITTTASASTSPVSPATKTSTTTDQPGIISPTSALNINGDELINDVTKKININNHGKNISLDRKTHNHNNNNDNNTINNNHNNNNHNNSQSTKQHHRKSHQNTNKYVRVKREPLKELSSNTESAILTPSECNYHEIKAIEGPAAFFDILSPPYDGPRICTFYKKVELKNELKLVRIQSPDDYYCDSVVYDLPNYILLDNSRGN